MALGAWLGPQGKLLLLVFVLWEKSLNIFFLRTIDPEMFRLTRKLLYKMQNRVS
jgi:hypothetical protein